MRDINTIFIKKDGVWESLIVNNSLDTTWVEADSVYISLHENTTWDTVKDYTWDEVWNETWEFNQRNWRRVV